MANLLENVITIQACNQLKQGSNEYNKQSELAKKVRAKFDLSKDLRMNISILHTYQLNGLCLINWNAWYLIPKEQTKQLNADAQEYIKNIRELNPEITAEIDEAIGLKPRRTTNKMQKDETFNF